MKPDTLYPTDSRLRSDPDQSLASTRLDWSRLVSRRLASSRVVSPRVVSPRVVSFRLNSSLFDQVLSDPSGPRVRKRHD